MRKILSPVTCDMKSIRAEKKVVLNQIRFQDYYRFEKRADKWYYRGTGYEHDIMGKRSTVNAFSKAYINTMRERVLAVQNSCIVIAGKIDEESIDDVIPLLEQLQPTNNALISSGRLPDHDLHREQDNVVFLSPAYGNAEILLSFDIPKEIEISDAEFLCGIIGQGDGSLLSVLLRENLAYTNEIYSYIRQLRCGSTLVIQCETSFEDAADCIHEILGVLDSVKEDIPENSYLAAKPFYTENREMLYDSTEKLANWMGYRFIYPDRFTTIDQQIQYCHTISIEKIKWCARKLFSGRNLYSAVSCLKKDRSRIISVIEKWKNKKQL